MAAIVEALRQQWSARDRYQVKPVRDSVDSPAVEIVGKDGEGYLVARGTKDDELALTSSSRCFAVPDHFSGAGAW